LDLRQYLELEAKASAHIRAFLHIELVLLEPVQFLFIQITVMVFTALHPLALLSTELYHRLRKRHTIQLVEDDDHPGLYRHRTEQERRRGNENAPREVNDDNIWS
jgi:hypothetical protein